MATPNKPLAPDPETDIDSPEIHDIPLRDLGTGEEEALDPEERRRARRKHRAWGHLGQPLLLPQDDRCFAEDDEFAVFPFLYCEIVDRVSFIT